MQVGLFEDALRSVVAVVVGGVAADVCDFVIGYADDAGVVGIVQIALDLVLCQCMKAMRRIVFDELSWRHP